LNFDEENAVMKIELTENMCEEEEFKLDSDDEYEA
jgi:hypothetical protein